MIAAAGAAALLGLVEHSSLLAGLRVTAVMLFTSSGLCRDSGYSPSRYCTVHLSEAYAGTAERHVKAPSWFSHLVAIGKVALNLHSGFDDVLHAASSWHSFLNGSGKDIDVHGAAGLASDGDSTTWAKPVVTICRAGSALQLHLQI